MLRRAAIRRLPPGYDVDIHFKPRYQPWDQRLCLIPDGDLYAAISTGRVSVVTDRIAEFTPAGLRLASGAELDADIVVTATGLRLLALGGIGLAVDGRAVSLPETVAYKGMMLSGVPNFAFTVGYTNASWTLKAELICRYVCRLLNHMTETGTRQCTPRRREASVEEAPFLDLTSGYVQRSIHLFPKQGAKVPWRLHQNYARDLMMLQRGKVEDGVMEFSNPAPGARREEADRVAAAS
jgi:cation diffusion facilitator CzcD-associated flavoprotein CzcO